MKAPLPTYSPVWADFDTWAGFTANTVPWAPPPFHARLQQSARVAASSSLSSVIRSSPSLSTSLKEGTPGGNWPKGSSTSAKPCAARRLQLGAPWMSAWRYMSLPERCFLTTESLPFASRPPTKRCPPEIMLHRCCSNQRRFDRRTVCNLPLAFCFASFFRARLSATSVSVSAVVAPDVLSFCLRAASK